MSEINLIKPDTDLNNVKVPIGWDLVIGNVPYDVYRIEGFVHTLGGKLGKNCYWTCESNKTPSYETLIPFSGDAPAWGVIFDRSNAVVAKWDKSNIECYGTCWITRNGKKFYRIPARTMDYGLATAQYTLIQLLENCPVEVSMRGYKEKNIGRKIYWREQPAIIDSWSSDHEMIIVPDEELFTQPVYWGDEQIDRDMWLEDYSDRVKIDILDKNIWWWRT